MSGRRHVGRVAKDVPRCRAHRRRARAGAGALHWLRQATPVLRAPMAAMAWSASCTPTRCTWPTSSGSSHLDLEPAAGARQLARATQTGNDRRFLDNKRHDMLAPLTMKFGRSQTAGRRRRPRSRSCGRLPSLARTWRPSRRRAASAADSQPCSSSLAMRSACSARRSPEIRESVMSIPAARHPDPGHRAPRRA